MLRSTVLARRLALPVVLVLASMLWTPGALGWTAPNSPSITDPHPETALRSWLILAPIPVGGNAEVAPSEAEQEDAFLRDQLLALGGVRRAAPTEGAPFACAGRTLTWQRVDSKVDAIDLAVSAEAKHAIAYAFARIEMPSARRVLFGLGSDDGVKLWLNGQLVHTRWVSRGVRADDDVFALDLRRGSNRLLLKVQNRGQGWGFVFRPITASRASERLAEMAIAGDLEGVRGAAGVSGGGHARGKYGLTPYEWARVLGRKGMMATLEPRGTTAANASATPESVVDAFFEDVIRPGQPGAAVLVAHNGRIVFEKAYGLADVETGKALTLDSRFGIASITKPVTAAAVLKLEEEGRLSLDDTLARFIPDYPRGGEITLRHLVTHTSGIRDTLGGTAALPAFFAPPTREHVIASFEYLPLGFNPGAQYAYCNPGYYLLGTIIEKVSGLSYLDFLHDRFFAPFGMTKTGVLEPGERGKAMPYWYADGKLEGLRRMTEKFSPLTRGGQGVLDSTVGDLHRFTEAYFDGGILSQAGLAAALTPSVHGRTARSRTRTGGYGLGWGLGRLRGLREVFHTGGGYGYSGVLYRFPDARFTVIILTNANAPIPTYDPSAAAEMIAQLYLHDQMEPRAETTTAHPALRTYDAYVGRYDLGSDAILTVAHDGSHLFGQTSGHPRIELFPESGTSFSYDRGVFDADVEFVKDEQGTVIQVVHCVGGDAVIAPRLPSVPRSTLIAYAGAFRIANGQLLAVTLEGDSLFAQIAGQPKLELLPRSATTFFLREAKAVLEFTADGDGVVRRVVLEQDGRTVAGTRDAETPAMVPKSAPAASITTAANPAPLAPAVRRPERVQAIVVPMAGSYAQHGIGLEMLAAFLASKGITPAGPPFGRYLHDRTTTPEPDLRWDVGFPVADPPPTVPKPFELRTLDDALIATATVSGPHAEPRPWPALMQWIERNAYAPVGPTMETWLDGPASEMRVGVRPAATQ